MTYEKFNQFLVELKRLQDAEKEFNVALKKFAGQFSFYDMGWHEQLTVNILREVFDDKDDWIGYWIYERDWKPCKKGDVKEKDGKNIPLRNNKDLYNLLTK